MDSWRGRPLVGRSEELSELSSRASDARKGRAQVVLIEGDAGYGKTELVRHFLRQSCDGFVVIRAEAEELATDATLYLLGQLGVSTTDGPFAAGMELVGHLAEQQDLGPVALVIEDLHWADPASQDALLLAARRLREDRVLVIATTRPDAARNAAWERFALSDDRGSRIRLTPLSVDDVLQLADGLHIPLNRRGAERLHRHTAGHPLYLCTLLSELTPAQLAGRGDDLPAPTSLALTTVSRMAQLSADARALGSALAVLRQRTPLPTVAAVAALSEPSKALDELLASGFVTAAPGEPGTPVEYVHPLYSTAVYEDLSPTRRQELHRAAAAVVEQGAAMEHRFRAADTFDDDLAAQLDGAAAGKTADGELGTAATYMLWSASLSAKAAVRERRLQEAVSLVLQAGETERAEGLRAQLEACADSTFRDQLLGTLAWDEGDAVESEKWLTRAIDGADPEADRVPLAASLALKAYLCVTHGRMDEGLALARRAFDLGLPDRRSDYLGWAALTVGQGAFAGATKSVPLLADRLPSRPDDVAVEDCDLLVLRGLLNFYGQRAEATIADLRAAVKLLRHGPIASELARAHLHLGQMLFLVGDWDGAHRHGAVALSLSSDDRQTWVGPQAHCLLSSILASRGQMEDASAHLEAAREGFEKADSLEAYACMIITEADIAWARGDSERVVQLFLPFVGDGDARALTMMSALVWWTPLVLAALNCGQAELAATLISQFESAAEMRGLDVQARLAGLRGRAASEAGSVDEALGLFAESVESFTLDDPVLDQALIRQAYGRLLLAIGERRRATDQLRAAHQILSSCGATPFLDRLAADLDRCGVRADTRKSRERFSLTDRERDVAVLVARGLTNAEVAAELYVSKKAVEFHLGNIFGKLGITSRRQLRGLQLA